MTKLLFIPFFLFAMHTQAQTNYIKLSQDLLYAAKTGGSLTSYLLQLTQIDEPLLNQELSDDNKRKAFWLNIYNSFVQLELKKDPTQYRNRNAFFKKKFIPIGKTMTSLDQVEHGILRRSRTKWSLGHVGKLFPSAFEKNFRVDKIDRRIHFALNCGAKSCPPIAFYDDTKIDRQLDLATRNFLRNALSEKKPENNIVYLPAFMSWFRADFDGKKGMLQLLRQYELVDKTISYKIKFSKYNWDLELASYSE